MDGLTAEERRLVPVKILGPDDWLIYGRTADGTLVYTVIEMDWHWMEAPHKGNCWSEETGRNCQGETMSVCRFDHSYMVLWVTNHRDGYYWQECDNDPVSGEYMGWAENGDEAFMASARRNYLID